MENFGMATTSQASPKRRLRMHSKRVTYDPEVQLGTAVKRVLKAAMDRPLVPHFETAYEMALQCRLNAPP